MIQSINRVPQEDYDAFLKVPPLDPEIFDILPKKESSTNFPPLLIFSLLGEGIGVCG